METSKCPFLAAAVNTQLRSFPSPRHTTRKLPLLSLVGSSVCLQGKDKRFGNLWSKLTANEIGHKSIISQRFKEIQIFTTNEFPPMTFAATKAFPGVMRLPRGRKEILPFLAGRA